MLDEPTNGLDPGEMREIRGLLQRLSNEGVTVLLSSHLLSEIEQVCTHVVVMNQVLSGRRRDGCRAHRIGVVGIHRSRRRRARDLGPGRHDGRGLVMH